MDLTLPIYYICRKSEKITQKKNYHNQIKQLTLIYDGNLTLCLQKRNNVYIFSRNVLVSHEEPKEEPQ